MNFWQEMKKPILCLAPMADVTDVAFRHIIAKYSDIPYITYTEFVSADGLVKAPEAGRRKLLKDLEYSEIERPIVAQFFTGKPEIMEKVATLAVELGFDGVDINMGCPDKSIEKQGAGAVLMKNPFLARELIQAAKRGIEKASLRQVYGGRGKIPVSVKTRLGYNKDELETWLPELLTENPAAIILHARTRKEMSKAPARWDRIKRAVQIRDELSKTRLDTKTLIIGNGDVENVEDAYSKTEETGADGVMLGRAVFGNPWLFADYTPNMKEKLKVLTEHTKLFEEKLGGVKSFAVMKKHFKAYLSRGAFLSGVALAKSEAKWNLLGLKQKLMQTNNAQEVEYIINEFLI